MVEKRPLTNLYENLSSLAGLITRADIAVCAGGVNTWERACLRLPSLVITVADNQKEFTEALHKEGYLKLSGDAISITQEEISPNSKVEKKYEGDAGPISLMEWAQQLWQCWG